MYKFLCIPKFIKIFSFSISCQIGRKLLMLAIIFNLVFCIRDWEKAEWSAHVKYFSNAFYFI